MVIFLSNLKDLQERRLWQLLIVLLSCVYDKNSFYYRLHYCFKVIMIFFFWSHFGSRLLCDAKSNVHILVTTTSFFQPLILNSQMMPNMKRKIMKLICYFTRPLLLNPMLTAPLHKIAVERTRNKIHRQKCYVMNNDTKTVFPIRAFFWKTLQIYHHHYLQLNHVNFQGIKYKDLANCYINVVRS